MSSTCSGFNDKRSTFCFYYTEFKGDKKEGTEVCGFWIRHGVMIREMIRTLKIKGNDAAMGWEKSPKGWGIHNTE